MLHFLAMFNLDVLLDILLTANYNSSTADYTWNIDNTYTHSGNPVQSTLQVGNYYDITLSVTDNADALTQLQYKITFMLKILPRRIFHHPQILLQS